MHEEEITINSETEQAEHEGEELQPAPSAEPLNRTIELSAKLEPFDSYWQAPDNREAGYKSFFQYYKHNYLAHLPQDKTAKLLVISCGPGYLVNMLEGQGYENVLGIDSDAEKIAFARKRKLNCMQFECFPFLEGKHDEYDVIIAEQELNHLTLNEMISFVTLSRESLRQGGRLIVYTLNGANPLVGSENLSHNIDHFNTLTEYSVKQVLSLGGMKNIQVFPLKLYVFWKNPMNYVGLLATMVIELFFRACFALYGKKVKILTKKLLAVCEK